MAFELVIGANIVITVQIWRHLHEKTSKVALVLGLICHTLPAVLVLVMDKEFESTT